ncbi:hypothetical protein GUJ93_ZPchr0014g47255 [Zizania palustris]|uniref:Uncharacterized protein n=1 Tax=Zizania palustris TaxID=103762 RepID=A0A8J5SWP7_ZIZPA|nr:hypothetical protein GUJ93_ZPchr0014g47255 [Zizania palustris]
MLDSIPAMFDNFSANVSVDGSIVNLAVFHPVAIRTKLYRLLPQLAPVASLLLSDDTGVGAQLWSLEPPLRAPLRQGHLLKALPLRVAARSLPPLAGASSSSCSPSVEDTSTHTWSLRPGPNPELRYLGPTVEPREAGWRGASARVYGREARGQW